MNTFQFKHDCYFNQSAAAAGVALCEANPALNGFEMRSMIDRAKNTFFDLVKEGADPIQMVAVESCLVGGEYLGSRGSFKDHDFFVNEAAALAYIASQSSAASRPSTIYMIYPAVTPVGSKISEDCIRKNIDGRNVQIYQAA